MEDSLSKIEEVSKNGLEASLLDAHNYWLRMRLFFNLIVGAAGTLATLLYAETFTTFDLLGILMWGFVANGLYSSGYSLESYVITQHPKVKFRNYRFLLFYIGTLLYSFVSFFYAQLYYSSFAIID